MWKTGTPERTKDGVKCQAFFAVGKYSDVASIEYYHFDDGGWLDYDGNERSMRLWMEIPEIEPLRESK